MNGRALSYILLKGVDGAASMPRLDKRREGVVQCNRSCNENDGFTGSILHDVTLP
jgi:hypothetical protein